MINKKLSLGLALVIMLSLISMSAFAATDATIESGSLSVTAGAIENFTTVTLNGQVQTITTTIEDATITDATGSGAGWSVAAAATPFTNSTAPDLLQELSSGSLVIAKPSVTAVTGASEDSDTNIVKLGGIIDSTEGIKVLSSIENQGMGTYTASFGDAELTLTLTPSEVYAGTYTTTITTSITSAP